MKRNGWRRWKFNFCRQCGASLTETCFQWLFYLLLTNAIVLIKYRRPCGCRSRHWYTEHHGAILRHTNPVPWFPFFYCCLRSIVTAQTVTDSIHYKSTRWDLGNSSKQLKQFQVNNQVAALVCLKDTQNTSLSPVVCGQIKHFITFVHQDLELIRACQSKCYHI